MRTDPQNAFILPVDKTGTLSFKSNEQVDINCPGGFINISNTVKTESQAIATCRTDNNFELLGIFVPLSEVKCTTYPKHEARFSGQKCVGTDLQKILIGFPVSQYEFLPQITVCFDTIQKNAVMSMYTLSHAIGGYQVNYPRPDFSDGGFYDLPESVKTLYTRKHQREVINTALGLPVGNYKYVHDTDDFYLARGHLTAKADFIYGSQQRSTFYYVNAAPQWQTLNGENWNTLEQNVRDFASERGLDLVVYTGTYGLSSLPSESLNHEPVELFLYYGQNGMGMKKNALPVPAIFWKVVYDPKSQRGIALVGVNNPYNPKLEFVLCEDVCAKVDWLTWDRRDFVKGYGYCCEVNELRKTVDYLPKLKVKGLLGEPTINHSSQASSLSTFACYLLVQILIVGYLTGW